MAELNLDPLEESDLLNADSLNSRFTAGGNSFQDTINNLIPDSVGPGCFNENHAPSPVLFQSGVTIGGPGAAGHTYTRGASAANNDTSPPSWTVLNSAGLAGSGTDLAITGLNYTLTSTTASQGILVMADLHVRTIIDNVPAKRFTGANWAVFAIQVRKTSGSGAWDTLTRTVRYLSDGIILAQQAGSQSRRIHIRVPIRTLLKTGDTSTSVIREIRAVVSLACPTNSMSLTTTLEWAQLSAIVLKAKRT